MGTKQTVETQQQTAVKDSKPSGGMGGFAKGLAVIEAFGTSDLPLTIAEVARISDLDRATARRCILTLVHTGYASVENQKYQLTPRILHLSQAYLNASLPRLLQPSLEQLAANLKESCSAAALDGDEIIYIARASQQRVMSIGLNLGSRLPAYCTSMGRILLAALPVEEARALLEKTTIERHTEHTITDLDELMAVLDKVRTQGYELVDQELEIGLRSLAVPLTNRAGDVIAALNIGTQAARVSQEHLLEMFLPQLLKTQQQLAKILP